jgi:hypothetical protein
MRGGLFVATVLPVLIVEAGKAYRRHLKEKRKAAERQQQADLQELRRRIEALELRQRWTS